MPITDLTHPDVQGGLFTNIYNGMEQQTNRIWLVSSLLLERTGTQFLHNILIRLMRGEQHNISVVLTDESAEGFVMEMHRMLSWSICLANDALIDELGITETSDWADAQADKLFTQWCDRLRVYDYNDFVPAKGFDRIGSDKLQIEERSPLLVEEVIARLEQDATNHGMTMYIIDKLMFLETSSVDYASRTSDAVVQKLKSFTRTMNNVSGLWTTIVRDKPANDQVLHGGSLLIASANTYVHVQSVANNQIGIQVLKSRYSETNVATYKVSAGLLTEEIIASNE